MPDKTPPDKEPANAESLLKLANESGTGIQTLWFGYMTYGAFLAAAVSGTTHADIFLETPVSLNFLNLKLPLVGFYIVAPLLFVIFHIFLLLKLVLLAKVYGDFETRLKFDDPSNGDEGENVTPDPSEGVTKSGARLSMRNLVNTTIFLQTLKHEKSNNNLVKLVFYFLVVFTVFILPLLVLHYVFVKFLPYQYWIIALFHRLFITVDALALFGFLLAIASLRYNLAKKVRLVSASLPLLFVVPTWVLFTFPGEWLDANPVARWVLGVERTKYMHSKVGEGRLDAEIGFETTSFSHWFQTWLNVANLDLYDEAKFSGQVGATVNLFKRSFIGADFYRTDLRYANFRKSRLNGARFDRARLQGATFNGATATGATFDSANLNGAKFHRAYLQGAWFKRARVQGAKFNKAHLHGAIFDEAYLHGTLLTKANLQGASFHCAQMQASCLRGAKLLGANLSYAILWRSCSVDKGDIAAANFNEAIAEQKYRQPLQVDDEDNSIACNRQKVDELTPLAYTRILAIAKLGAPKGVIENRIEWRLRYLKPNSIPANASGFIEPTFLADHTRESDSTTAAETTLVINLACSANQAPFIARALIHSGQVERMGKLVANYILSNRIAKNGKPILCPGATGLDELSLRRLRKIAKKGKSGG